MKKIIIFILICISILLIWERIYFSIFQLSFKDAKVIADTYIKEKVKEETIYLKGEYDKASHLYDFSYQSKCCEYAILVDDIYWKVELEIWLKERAKDSK